MSLTPQKVGLVYCKILQELFRQRSNPGYIHANIKQAATGRRGFKDIGQLDVYNLIENNGTGPGLHGSEESLQPVEQNLIVHATLENSTDTVTVRPVTIDERVWLQLMATVMVWAFRHPFEERLVASLGSRPYRFPCTVDQTKGLSLMITTAAVRASAPYTWLDLVSGLKLLLTQAAQADKWETVYLKPIRCSGMVIAWLSIENRVGEGTPDEGSISDITA